jgi:tetratricopeptide (TPR) repeat protein
MFSVLLIIISVLLPPVHNGLDPQARSDEARRLFAEARDAASRSDWTVAERNYLLLLKVDPGWAEAIVNLGIVYNREGKTEEAIDAFKKAVEADPKLFGARLNLGITYFRLHRFDDAEDPLKQATIIDPQSDQAARLLIMTLFARKKFAEVASMAGKLLGAAPDDPALLEIAGRAYLNQREYTDALKALEARAKLQPESAEIYQLLGEARDNVNDSEGALKEFRHAIALLGGTPLADIHFDSGYVLWKLRRYEEASVEFELELKGNPNHLAAVYYLGNIALSRNDLASALPLLERAAQAMPESFAARYDLGKALVRSEAIARAEEELRTAITLNPKISGAHYELAIVLKKLGRQEEADRELKIARDLNQEERIDLERKVQGEENKKRAP